MAATKTDPNLLRPLVLSGPAVERDRRVKDLNDSVKPDEEVWYEKALAQDAEISASEVEFFATLRGRIRGTE
jgi:hypothetical protein